MRFLFYPNLRAVNYTSFIDMCIFVFKNLSDWKMEMFAYIYWDLWNS